MFSVILEKNKASVYFTVRRMDNLNLRTYSLLQLL